MPFAPLACTSLLPNDSSAPPLPKARPVLLPVTVELLTPDGDVRADRANADEVVDGLGVLDHDADRGAAAWRYGDDAVLSVAGPMLSAIVMLMPAVLKLPSAAMPNALPLMVTRFSATWALPLPVGLTTMPPASAQAEVYDHRVGHAQLAASVG